MSKPLLWTRAVVLAVVALGAGIVSHVAADGALPHPVVLLALLGLTSVLAVPFLRARATAGRLALLVVGGQAMTHVALSGLAGHAGDRPAPAAPAAPGPALPTGPGPRTGPLVDQYAAGAPTSTGPGTDPVSWLTDAAAHQVGHQLSHLAEQGLAMVLAHTLGAVALGLWLALGETALWRLIHLGLARLEDRTRALALLRWAVAAVRDALGSGRARPPLVAGGPPPRPRLLTHQLARRGPPRLLAA